jgi:hypothetical protein
MDLLRIGQRVARLERKMDIRDLRSCEEMRILDWAFRREGIGTYVGRENTIGEGRTDEKRYTRVRNG